MFFHFQSQMLANDQPGIEVELHNQIVKASCQLLKSAGEVLRLSPMPGRRHYIFNLKDLASCFQVIIARKVSFFNNCHIYMENLED